MVLRDSAAFFPWGRAVLPLSEDRFSSNKHEGSTAFFMTPWGCAIRRHFSEG